LHQRFTADGYSESKGDWVVLPLWAGNSCLGVLSLDNYTEARPVIAEQIRQFTLFGQQFAAALERSQLYEQERRTAREIEVLAEIGRLAADRAATADLVTLLHEVRRLLGQLINAQNFFVALYDDLNGQIELRLDVDADVEQRTHSFPITSGLVGYVIRENRELLLRSSAALAAFHSEHDVRRHEKGKPATCWLGVPLTVAGRAIGAIVVQNEEEENVFTDEDRRLLVAVAAQVAGIIQTARLKEAADVSADRLAVLQRAGEVLMQLGERGEKQLWHATLTLITAGYALAFNRGMLFLLDDGGEVLRGRIGIGHLDGREARASWARDERSSLDFEGYLARLSHGKLRGTPVNRLMPTLHIHLPDDQSAFGQVLRERRRAVVLAQEAEVLLPTAFLDAFGVKDYALLPIYVGEKRLGVVVVDNAHTGVPLQNELLDQLETLLAQVALVYENLRWRRATDKLIDVNHTVLAKIVNQRLSRTLTAICNAAQKITEADSVVIYPFAPDSTHIAPEYDNGSIGHVGLPEHYKPRQRPNTTGITFQVLQKRDIVIIEDTSQEIWMDGRPLVEHSFFKREKIQAFIGTPIQDAKTGAVMGVLYLNYRRTQTFSERDKERVRSFASLAGAAIGSSRVGEERLKALGVAEKESAVRGQELEALRQVLETALKSGAGIKEVAQVLLVRVRDLLSVRGAKVALILRDWAAPSTEHSEPEEVRRQYYLDHTNTLAERSGQSLFTGITGRAFSDGTDQYVPDVTLDPKHLPWRSDKRRKMLSEVDILIKLEEHEILGLLNVEAPFTNAFSDEMRGMLHRVAAATALALDNIGRQQDLLGLLDAVQAVTKPSSLSETLLAVLNVAREIVPGVSAVTIWHIDQETGRIRRGPFFGVLKPSLVMEYDIGEIKPVVRVMQKAQPIWATDVQDEPCLAGRFINQEQIASAAAFPLEIEGEVVGAIFFNYRKPHWFTGKERVLLPILATIASSNVRDARRLDKLVQANLRFEAAVDITEAVGTKTNLSEILRAVLDILRGLFPTAQPAVLTYSERRRELEFRKESYDFYDIQFPERIGPLAIDDEHSNRSIACRVARKALTPGGTSLVNIPDVSADPDYLETKSNTRSQLSLALVNSGRLLGVLVLESERIDAFNTTDELLLKGVGQAISIALDRAQRGDDLVFQRNVATATSWVAEFAHEINRELRNIRYHAHKLGSKAPAEMSQHYDAIEQSTELLATLSKASRSTEFEILVLDEWLEEKINAAVKAAGKQADGIDVRFVLGCPALRVRASPILLERVLQHLVRNAVRAVAGAGHLTVQTLHHNRSVEIQITNTGGPIPEHVRDRLFVAPVTTKDPQGAEDEGGLGLLFVRWAIEAMDGMIELVPGRDDEVTFALTLPFVAEDKEQRYAIGETQP
jgi:GAF domain-containing protein